MIGLSLSAFLHGASAKIAGLIASMVIVAAIIYQVFSMGKKSAKLDTLQNTLKDKALEAQVNADIAATSAAVRRKQLLNRWSKR